MPGMSGVAQGGISQATADAAYVKKNGSTPITANQTLNKALFVGAGAGVGENFIDFYDPSSDANGRITVVGPSLGSTRLLTLSIAGLSTDRTITAPNASGTCSLDGRAAVSQATPAAPTGTTSTAGVMMGLAGAITPVTSGRILIVISGTMLNSTAIGDGGKVQIRYGTGAAPANGAALTGTAAGGLVQYVAALTSQKDPWGLNAVVTGLTLSTAVWIDVGLAAIVGGTASITDVSISVVEI